MDNENNAGKPRSHKGFSRPSGNDKGRYKGGKPSSGGNAGSRGFGKQGGKPGFRDGKRTGGKRYGQGSGKPRSGGFRGGDDRRSSGNAGRGAEDRGYRSKPASDRTEGGYKGSYRGGDRNRRLRGSSTDTASPVTASNATAMKAMDFPVRAASLGSLAVLAPMVNPTPAVNSANLLGSAASRTPATQKARRAWGTAPARESRRARPSASPRQPLLACSRSRCLPTSANRVAIFPRLSTSL